MLAACLLLTAATVGADFGWQSTDKGELEYIIQFEPELIDQLKSGKPISYQLPPEIEGRVRAFRIQVGTDDLDKTIPAGFTQQSKFQEADGRPQLLAVNTPILSTPPVPLSAARREIEASINAAADTAYDLVAQYTPRSTRTLPQYSTQTGSNPSTATGSQAQSQPAQQPPSSSFSIPGASERYGDSAPTVSRFNDGQSTTGSSTTSQNSSTPTTSTGGQFSNSSGSSNSGTSGQQAPGLGQFNPGGTFNPTGTNNNGSTSNGATTTGQATNNGQSTTGGQGGSTDGNSTRGRWGNRGPQTDHQPLNNTNDLVSPVNQDQWTTQQPQQNSQQQGNGQQGYVQQGNNQQGSGQPPLTGGGYGNQDWNLPNSMQNGQGGNNPNYNQNPQQNNQAPPFYNAGNQGNFGQYPPQQQQQPNQPPYAYPNQNGYPNQGQVPLIASVPQQQPPPLATPVSTEATKPEEKPVSPSDTPAPSKPEVVTEVKVEAPEWWFMVAIGFMMSLFFNFWSWKVSQEIRQKYDDLLEDVRDMRSLPEA